jgi:hypothetical protein
MTVEDWSTLAGLHEIRRARSGRIDGWAAPVAYAVGFRRRREWVFPYVNRPGGTHGLPVVILAEVVGYACGTREFSVSAACLARAIVELQPAEAATDVDHPNLAAWRTIAAADPDEIAAVFIGSLNDPIVGPADAALRALMAGANVD